MGYAGVNQRCENKIVLPPGVTTSDIKTTSNFYNGTSIVNEQLAVYWEKPVIQPNEQFEVGVSFHPVSCQTMFPALGEAAWILDLLTQLLGLQQFSYNYYSCLSLQIF